LAYKLDTLVVNRILDQMGRPLPELIRVGSLSEVCRSLGTQDTGPNIANIKAAFLQNASTFINARVRYKTRNGREKHTEIGYTRYSVVFTGERLPDGTQADAVHIILNPPYREFLNHVETRPLDYEYLKKLPPGPQRFYELLSFQIYGAIAGGRARAKLLYSEYCSHAPQVRYGTFDQAKKQMFKLHAPHRTSGYISKVDYQEIAGEDGNVDWEMFYTPGPKAYVEYQAFTNRQLPASLAGPSQLTRDKAAGQGIPVQATLGLYVFYIRDNIAAPATFFSSRKTRLHEEAQQVKNKERAREARLEIDYEAYCAAEVARFAEAMPAEEYKQLFDEQRRHTRTLFKSMTPEQLDDVTHRSIRGEIENKGLVPILSFKEFAKRQLAEA